VEHFRIRRKLIFFSIRQLFDECLAPNTMGDGTGCDNMTAMIVRLDRFLPQFQEFADSAAMDETSVSTPGSAHPVKRPLNHDNSTDENGDSKPSE
jgi:protein phosphatase 1G